MSSRFEQPVTKWFAETARDLPWRRPGAGAWPILVSEVMLQQTPVSRVLPAYRAWLARWPTAPALAAAAPADALRQWDRLGYPRRAIRLHATATLIADQHGGEVPGSVPALLGLPGIGGYTAAAVAAFAFGQRHPVLDTNVRRVLARLVGGQDRPATGPVSAAEIALAESLLPPAGANRAARWSAAVMELGALVCTATRPACGICPVAADCAWLRNGSPAGVPARSAVRYLGSDRQCRGALLAVLRAADGPVPAVTLDASWPVPEQRAAVLDGLIADGLAVRTPDARIALPGEAARL